MISTNASSSPLLNRRTSPASYCASCFELAARAVRSADTGVTLAGGGARARVDVFGLGMWMWVYLTLRYLGTCQTEIAPVQPAASSRVRFSRVTSPMQPAGTSLVQAARLCRLCRA